MRQKLLAPRAQRLDTRALRGSRGGRLMRRFANRGRRRAVLTLRAGWLLACASHFGFGTTTPSRPVTWNQSALGVASLAEVDAALIAPFSEPFEVKMKVAANPETRRSARN